MVGGACRGGVEHADVDDLGHARRVGGSEVRLHVADGVALPVHHRAEVVEDDALRLVRVQEVHVRRKGERAGDLAGRVMVPRGDHDGDALVLQDRHLLDEVLPGAEVVPAAVVEVTGDDEQIGLALDGPS